MIDREELACRLLVSAVGDHNTLEKLKEPEAVKGVITACFALSDLMVMFAKNGNFLEDEK